MYTIYECLTINNDDINVSYQPTYASIIKYSNPDNSANEIFANTKWTLVMKNINMTQLYYNHELWRYILKLATPVYVRNEYSILNFGLASLEFEPNETINQDYVRELCNMTDIFSMKLIGNYNVVKDIPFYQVSKIHSSVPDLPRTLPYDVYYDGEVYNINDVNSVMDLRDYIFYKKSDNSSFSVMYPGMKRDGPNIISQLPGTYYDPVAYNWFCRRTEIIGFFKLVIVETQIDYQYCRSFKSMILYHNHSGAFISAIDNNGEYIFSRENVAIKKVNSPISFDIIVRFNDGTTTNILIPSTSNLETFNDIVTTIISHLPVQIDPGTLTQGFMNSISSFLSNKDFITRYILRNARRVRPLDETDNTIDLLAQDSKISNTELGALLNLQSQVVTTSSYQKIQIYSIDTSEHIGEIQLPLIIELVNDF